jgi:hypothetical protein
MILTRKQFYNSEGIEVVQQEIDGQTRWGIVFVVVVKRISDGTFWRAFYEEGATENQEGDYDDDIEFNQVYPVEKTVTVYEEKV